MNALGKGVCFCGFRVIWVYKELESERMRIHLHNASHETPVPYLFFQRHGDYH